MDSRQYRDAQVPPRQRDSDKSPRKRLNDMVLIRSESQSRIECSAKVLKELGKQGAPYGDTEVDPFFSWYCNLFFIDGKRCLLFVNTLSRYPILRFYVSRQDIGRLNELLQETLADVLRAEGVSDNLIFQVIQPLAKPELTKSKNRSIIGSTVDYQRLILTGLDYEPREMCDLRESLDLARTPIIAMKGDSFPYSVFREELQKRYGETGHFPNSRPK